MFLGNALVVVIVLIQVQDIVPTGEVILYYQPEFHRRSHVCCVDLNAYLRGASDGENGKRAS